jgi:hypothetical protein
VNAMAYKADPSLPSQLSAKLSSPTLLKKRLIDPKLGSYMKSQIIPTDTEERIVGKKNSVLSAILTLEFLSKKSAKTKDKTV